MILFILFFILIGGKYIVYTKKHPALFLMGVIMLVQEGGNFQTTEKSDFLKKSDFFDFWVVRKLSPSCTSILTREDGIITQNTPCTNPLIPLIRCTKGERQGLYIRKDLKHNDWDCISRSHAPASTPLT